MHGSTSTPMYDAPHLIYIHHTNNISEVFTSTSRYFGFLPSYPHVHSIQYLSNCSIFAVEVDCDKHLTPRLPLLLLPLPSCHSGRCCTAVCCLLAMLPVPSHSLCVWMMYLPMYVLDSPHSLDYYVLLLPKCLTAHRPTDRPTDRSKHNANDTAHNLNTLIGWHGDRNGKGERNTNRAKRRGPIISYSSFFVHLDAAERRRKFMGKALHHGDFHFEKDGGCRGGSSVVPGPWWI